MSRSSHDRARPALPRTVWILGIVSLLMDLSSEIYHALLPAFLTVTLGLPVAAMGALDGVAEATANMAKLASGRLSDRSRRRKPWILLGYGMAALSKPLFPLAASALPVLGARFIDRVGKGIRGAPRDAMIADETPPELARPRLRPAPVARHRRRLPCPARRGRADDLVRRRHPRGVLGRGDPRGAVVPVRLGHAARERATMPRIDAEDEVGRVPQPRARRSSG